MAKKKSTTVTSRGGYVVSIDRATEAKSEGRPSDEHSPSPIMNINKENTAQNPNTEASEPLVRHPEFFFDNTLVAIRIENTLFNVHKYQLVKSKVFLDILNNAPDSDGDECEEIGSPDVPVVMQGISASDFAALLKILYASHWSGPQPTTEASLIVPAFRVANILQFSEVRTHLLPLAEKSLDDVDKIVFAREFDIKEWLAPAHARLCQREKSLGTKEARKLQVDSVLLILRLREKYLHQNRELSPGSDYCANCYGLSYHGNYNSCNNCSNNHGFFRCTGPGAGRGKSNIDNSQIEAEVAKWVENGFVMDDE